MKERPGSLNHDPKKGEVYVVDVYDIFNYNTEYAKSIGVYDGLTNFDVFNREIIMGGYIGEGLDFNTSYILVKYLGEDTLVTEDGLRINLFFGFDPDRVQRKMEFSSTGMFIQPDCLLNIHEGLAALVANTNKELVDSYLLSLSTFANMPVKDIMDDFRDDEAAAYGYNRYFDFKNGKTR